MSKKRIVALLSIPVISVGLYFGLKLGYVDPMIKGIDIQMIGGTFITNLNKYVIKVGDQISISTGDYIVIPGFSKKPNLKFINLDDKGVISIEGNQIKALKTGYSTIGLINKNRVLKKVTIMVVDPNINNMEISLSNPIRYFGDKANITSTVNVDEYKKLEDGYKLNYSTTDDKILKVKGDSVEAVGVGKVKLISRYGRKEIQTSLEVLPRVDSIEIGDYYKVENGESISLNPSIKTTPSYKSIDPKYTVVDEDDYTTNKVTDFGESGLETTYGLSISKDGVLSAGREGHYLARITAGRVSKDFVVDVVRTAFENIVIKNLQYHITKQGNGMDVEIGFDYNDRVNKYRVYLKGNDDEDYYLYTTVNVGSRSNVIGGRVNTVVKIEDLPSSYRYRMYVVGVRSDEVTKRSNEIEISSKQGTSYQSKKISNLKYRVDEENGTIRFNWKPIGKGDYSYRLYYKNNYYKDSKPILMAKNIKDTSCVIKVDKEKIDYDFYVMGVDKSGQVSDFSSPVRVNESLSE